MCLWFLRKVILFLLYGSIHLFAFDLSNVKFSTLDEAQPTESSAYGPVALGELGKAMLLDVLNTGRSNVDPPAVDMNKVVWSTEQADQASTALESCIYEISLPTSTSWIQLTSFSESDGLLNKTLEEWYTFGDYYDYHQKSCLRPDLPIICQIYKLLTWSTMTSVGCAQHFCEYLWNSFTGVMFYDKLYWKCNFENIGDFTDASLNPYATGTVNESCTQCESGSGWCDNRLCSSECDMQTASCSCALDPLCNGNGTLNETTCKCNCSYSWIGNSCEQCGATCEDNQDLNSELCQCSCSIGYQVNETSRNCTDVDECRSLHECEHNCTNTLGSYYCTCTSGYFLNDDGYTCASSEELFRLLQAPHTTDVDECEKEIDSCEHNCTNTVGGYRCNCMNNYLLMDDGRSCRYDACNMSSTCNSTGLLDVHTCDCHCASGYKGDICEEKCSVNESKCWQGYERPPLALDADYCPRYCFECACDLSGSKCENNGTFSKVPGYELQYGMCRCYCPFPWSGLACEECNLSCYNGGTLDPAICSCTCPVGYRPPDCSAPCVDVSRWCSRRMAPLCDRVPVIRKNCPVMCGSCTQ
ncbi:multiple epidermal growth factor-like domains protein 6 [Acanthaster planci]|uniref:Multiple epidermal growth factor-like domains protein 6 n=1 Tax=Acanthaster planci TaxID=133434 RepID=A0A8B7ZUN6_ACAPL|nr:multiple epidermal growth factor-like domains protein 6 [Acanthaster planci]